MVLVLMVHKFPRPLIGHASSPSFSSSSSSSSSSCSLLMVLVLNLADDFLTSRWMTASLYLQMSWTSHSSSSSSPSWISRWSSGRQNPPHSWRSAA
ncbi:phosphatidylinositol 4-kinase gamma 4-like [Iris pallida]|uniref:Phosphatidylinositol 4-kinase gamma 4-like n=1 Tax=Iris pallida TaxID=29817 RepID=A0AAX6HKK2_IRIPA|nr:phosphatidylinositol 4-kinase gamma 4-like [Iris pallida]KAJ6841610.1 phosphatidylinositol 4-kinase gamma 4-like [Iris pallida]